MIVLILEFLAEFLIPFIGELLFDLLIHVAPRNPSAERTLNTLLTAIMYFGVGLFIGWVSVWFFPKAFVRSESLHGISLVITPVLAGLAMAAIGSLRARQGKLVIRLESFSYGFILAFGMALVRFKFTE